jgi:hypothetical protein
VKFGKIKNKTALNEIFQNTFNIWSVANFMTKDKQKINNKLHWRVLFSGI